MICRSIDLDLILSLSLAAILLDAPARAQLLKLSRERIYLLPVAYGWVPQADSFARYGPEKDLKCGVAGHFCRCTAQCTASSHERKALRVRSSFRVVQARPQAAIQLFVPSRRFAGSPRRTLPTAFPQATPRFATLSDLLSHRYEPQRLCGLCPARILHSKLARFCSNRKAAQKPHPSFDLNGDGQVGQREYYLASRFDANRNGVLEPVEIDKAQRAFAQGFGADEFRQYFSFNNLNPTRFDRVLQKTCRFEKTNFQDTFNRTVTDFDTRSDPFDTTAIAADGMENPPPNTRRHLLAERKASRRVVREGTAGVGSDEPPLCHARNPRTLAAEQKKKDVPISAGSGEEVTRLGFLENPANKTTTALMEKRKNARVPHESYDLDGDGVVAPRDYFIAKMFDRGDKHALSDQERSEAKMAIEQGLGKDSMEHYYAHCPTASMPQKPPLTRQDKVFQKTFAVRPTHPSHTHERVIGNWQSRNDHCDTMHWSSTARESMKQAFTGGPLNVREVYGKGGAVAKKEARPFTPPRQSGGWAGRCTRTHNIVCRHPSLSLSLGALQVYLPGQLPEDILPTAKTRMSK